MKMKVWPMVMFCAIALPGFQAVAQPPAPPPAGAEATQSDAARRPRRRRAPLTPQQQMERFGGFVEPAYRGRYVCFVNAQGRVPAEAIEWVAGQVRIALSLPARVVRPETPLRGDNIAEAVRCAKAAGVDAGGMVSVIDSTEAPTLLVAPDDGWAQVNVGALAKDNPSPAVLEARMKKEMWRAFIKMFGGGNSQNAMDVMRPIGSLADLDASETLVSSPEPFNSVLSEARARKITPVPRTTYKRACQEGWAPAPTNEFQKAIFDQVKADKERGPTNPITIPPPNKKK